jgi:serine phosphatase RsbU (regulator of sigma subunit)
MVYTVSERQWVLTRRILWVLLVLSGMAVLPAALLNNPLPWSALLGAPSAAVSLLLLRSAWRQAARWIVALLPSALIFAEGVLTFPNVPHISGYEWMLLSTATMPTLVFRATEWRKMVPAIALNALLVVAFPWANDALRLGEGMPVLAGPLFRWVAAGFGICLLLGALYNLLVVNYRVESHVVQLLDDSREKNEELLAQNDVIATQNRDITDSIVYARRIQQAILPSLQPLHSRGVRAEVLYAPKAIVSGDFYWCYAHAHRVTVAALDCTGHGVPGAFMSVLGYSLLNQLAAQGLAFSPAELLEALDEEVFRSLRQHSTERNAPLDGMDAVVLTLDTHTRTLTWASANRPLAWALPGGPVQWEKAHKRAIGGSRLGQEPFAQHTLQWATGMRLFLFTDGITDMTGGPQARKFTPKRLAEWMQNTQALPLPTALAQLAQAAQAWEQGTEPLDDKLLIALEV